MGKVNIIDGINFELHGPGCFGVLGPSGSGKSTLFDIIMGFIAPDKGSLEFEGERLSGDGNVHVEPHLRKFSIVFQEDTLLPYLSAIDNIFIGTHRRESEVKDEITSLVSDLELELTEKTMIHELSGGERQRIALARALIGRPRILLLDEPFHNLDRPLKERLYRILGNLLPKREMITLLVTHDFEEASLLCKEILVLNQGRIVAKDGAVKIYEQRDDHWLLNFTGAVNELSPGEAVALGLEGSQKRLFLRPEELTVEESTQGNGVVVKVNPRGGVDEVEVELVPGSSLVVRSLRDQNRLKEGLKVNVQLSDYAREKFYSSSA